MSEKTAENILPVELWTKILQFLHETHLRSVQDVCVLFWNIIQRFVEHGLIKSDFYVSWHILGFKKKRIQIFPIMF